MGSEAAGQERASFQPLGPRCLFAKAACLLFAREGRERGAKRSCRGRELATSGWRQTSRSQRSASPIANIRRMIVLITEFTQAARIERARGSVRCIRAIQREVLSTAGLHGTIPRQAQATLAKERGPSGLPHSYASRTAAVTRLSSPASSWPTNLPSGPSPAAMGCPQVVEVSVVHAYHQLVFGDVPQPLVDERLLHFAGLHHGLKDVAVAKLSATLR